MILGLRPAIERRRYKVIPPLIGWAQTLVYNHRFRMETEMNRPIVITRALHLVLEAPNVSW